MRIEEGADWRAYLPGHPAAERALVPLPSPAAVEEEVKAPARPDRAGAADTDAGLDVRSLTPRQMVDISMDLYVGGVLGWEEYAMLAFQPELHPDYDRTIGALTGEKAEPDRPRDFVAQWEGRLTFEEKHNADHPEFVGRTRRIVAALTQLGAEPTNLTA
jgi:hypothetical protein